MYMMLIMTECKDRKSRSDSDGDDITDLIEAGEWNSDGNGIVDGHLRYRWRWMVHI